MKRSIAVVCMLVVALVIVPMALAGNGNGHGNLGGHAWAHGKAKFQLNGVVVSADPATGSLVVKVKSGSKTVKQFRGQELTLLVDPEARFVDGTADDSGEASATLTLADLVAGARVHLGGRIDRTDPANPVFVARKVIVQRWPAVVAPEPSPSPSVEPSVEPTTGT
jgi:hypothetical protein